MAYTPDYIAFTVCVTICSIYAISLKCISLVYDIVYLPPGPTMPPTPPTTPCISYYSSLPDLMIVDELARKTSPIVLSIFPCVYLSRRVTVVGTEYAIETAEPIDEG